MEMKWRNIPNLFFTIPKKEAFCVAPVQIQRLLKALDWYVDHVDQTFLLFSLVLIHFFIVRSEDQLNLVQYRGALGV